ncbi:hypothetical protein QBC43DRAFT_105512 [Cladorrhinum sp. PSN259]|nr:hypothetical protein QBC43DRAFT_105512 [Cladorrhinum sp. PSN259]
MTNPVLPIPPNKGDASRPLRSKQSSILFTIYSWISTPILLLSFILSLIFIDLRNSARRAHFHADHHHSSHGPSSRMPGWLHKIIYKYRPYRYVVDGNGELKRVSQEDEGKEPRVKGIGKGDEEFYHSHQKKLAKMEMAEAFEMRGFVMVVLGLMAAGLGWGAWKVISGVWSVLRG